MKLKYAPLVLGLLVVPVKAQDNTVNVGYDSKGYIGVDLSSNIAEHISMGPSFGYAPKHQDDYVFRWNDKKNDAEYKGVENVEGYYLGLNFKYLLDKSSALNLGIMYENKNSSIVEEKTSPKGREVYRNPTNVRSNFMILFGFDQKFRILGNDNIVLGVNIIYNTSTDKDLKYTLPGMRFRGMNDDPFLDANFRIGYRF